MDQPFLPPVENVSVQRGFKQFNPDKVGSHLMENQNDFQKFPYTCFGYLHYRDRNTDKKKIIGQAVLIGPAHILTSAKNSGNENILNDGEIEFYCGNELEIQSRVIAIYCNSATIKSCKQYDQQDLAMCILEKEIGEKNGFLGIITPLQMSFFEEIQFKQQQVLVYDSQQVLSGQICDVDSKEMLIQFKNEQGDVMNAIDQEINSIEENSLEEDDEEDDDQLQNNQNLQQKKQSQMREDIRKDIQLNNKNNRNRYNVIFNKIVFIHDKIFGYAVLSTDAQRDGLYYKSQFLTNFHLYNMLFWYQGIEVNPKDQVQKIIEMKFLENKGNMKVEEPAEQENKPIVCLKQMNNQFIFTGNQDSSANFWHLGSLNIGQTLQREVFEYNFKSSTFNGIVDIVSDGYYGIALIGRYIILLNWLNFELLEAKEFDSDLTCIQKRDERFKYFVGDASGQILYLKLNPDNGQVEEDPEGSIHSKSQGNAHGHDKPIEYIYLIKEKKQVVVASQDGIRLWDVKSKKLAANIEGEQKKRTTFIGFSKARLYVAGEDHQLRIYDLVGKLYRSIRFQYPIKCGIFLNSCELALSEGKNLKIINVLSNDQDFYSVHKFNITHICRISDFQFITADTKGQIYKWTLMSQESDSSLQYRVALELSNNTQAHCSNFSPEKITKFFSSNLSPQGTSFHSQKLQQLKTKIELQRNLANQGIYEGNQKMVGDLYAQENYYLKAKVRNLESKVNAVKGEYSDSHKEFIQNSSFSRQNISFNNMSTLNKSVRDTSSSIALKTQKAQIKQMEQKLKEQEEIVLKIQEEEQILRNNAEKKVKQEKKAYMEKNVDDIKLNSQRFESKIPLIQNDIDLLRKQLSFMNDTLSDRQSRIRDRSSSLSKKQNDIQQFHNEIQQRDKNGQEQLNSKMELSKQQREKEQKELELLRNQNIQKKNELKIEDQKIYDGQDYESIQDDQVDLISQELDQTIKNSQNWIKSQQNQFQNQNINQDDSDDSNFKGSFALSSRQNNKNDDINNSNGSSINSCVLNNKQVPSQTQARNIMKNNRDGNQIQQLNELCDSGLIDGKEFARKENNISDIEEEDQDSYKYTNRKSSPNSNRINSQNCVELSDKEPHVQKSAEFAHMGVNKKGEQEEPINTDSNIKYSFIESQFKKLQQQVLQLQQNYQDLRQSSFSPQQNRNQQQNVNNIPQATVFQATQTLNYRPGELKPVLRLQQMSPVSLNSSLIGKGNQSPNQLKSITRLNNFIGQQAQQQGKVSQSPSTGYTQSTGVTRSISPNIIICNGSSLSNNISNSPALLMNTSTSFYVNSSPQRNNFSQIQQKSQINNTSSPTQIRILNNSMTGSQCEGINLLTVRSPPPKVLIPQQTLNAHNLSQSKEKSQTTMSHNIQQSIGDSYQILNSSQMNIHKQNNIQQQNHFQMKPQQNQQYNNGINGQIVSQYNLNLLNQNGQYPNDFIQQQLMQQQQQFLQPHNRISSTFSQQQPQHLNGQEYNQENEINIQRPSSQLLNNNKLLNTNQLQNRHSKSTISNEQAYQIANNQKESENNELRKQLQEQSLLMKDLSLLLEKQKNDINQRDEIIKEEKENNQLSQQKLIEQNNNYEQNIAKLSEQVIKQSELIQSLQQENLLQQQQTNDSLLQLENEKSILIQKINKYESELQQKNVEILQNQNTLNQMTITLAQLRQMTTYEEVDRLMKQIKVQENINEQLKNETKSQKQLLISQEKIIVDSQRIQNEFQTTVVQKQQLANENDILKSKLQIIESENKNLHSKLLTIREEIDAKYSAAIIEFQKLMQGHTNKQQNLQKSVENIKTGVLSGLDINALDKLIEMSNKKQQQQLNQQLQSQNLKSSGNLSNSIPLHQIQGQISDRAKNQQNFKQYEQSSSRQMDQSTNQRSYSPAFQFQKSNNTQNTQNKKYQEEQENSSSSIQTYNPDEHGRLGDLASNRSQNRSVSPINNNSNGNQSFRAYSNSFQQQQNRLLKGYDSRLIKDGDSIKSFNPDRNNSQSDENSESDYFSNVEVVGGQNQQQRKSAFRNNQQKHSPRELHFNQKVANIDEEENQKNKKEEGMCAQQ